MGACVSSRHNSSTMKVHVSSGSNRKPENNVVMLPSPVKGKVPIVNGDVAVKPQWLPLRPADDSLDFGSREEKFFDSQAWLDSDCESDFMSVKGEFTPSRGNTPVHHTFPTALPQKKKLSELFSESQRESRNCDQDYSENGAVRNLEAVAVHGDGLKSKKGRWVEIVQVHNCLPRVHTLRQK